MSTAGQKTQHIWYFENMDIITLPSFNLEIEQIQTNEDIQVMRYSPKCMLDTKILVVYVNETLYVATVCHCYMYDLL